MDRTATRLARLAALAAAGLVGVAGCEDEPGAERDGGPARDGGALSDGGLPRLGDGGVLFADFVVTGCVGAAPDGGGCRGAAPLAVTFLPLVPPLGAATYRWEFGDAADAAVPESTDEQPTHRYALPGRYDVRLAVAAADGTASVTKPAFVSVDPTRLGGCDLDLQCVASRPRCLCAPPDAADPDRCPGELAGGICAGACDACDPAAGDVCADLSLGGVGPTFRAPLCLAGCGAEADCPGPLSCRELPAGDGRAPAWRRACFAGFPRDVGAACRAPDGAPDGAACLGGLCEELGARGLCSAACEPGECPGYAACARLGDGRTRCLARCAPERPCDGDPLLSCEAADPTGGLGFIVLDPGEPAAARYCAPRRCVEAADCGLEGACVDDTGARFCQAR